jgi:hypothetical protein
MMASDWKMLGRVTLGVGVFGMGAIIGLISLLAILDPAGVRMANDADPFGKPPSMMYDVVLLGVSGVFMAGAVWLARKK